MRRILFILLLDKVSISVLQMSNLCARLFKNHSRLVRILVVSLDELPLTVGSVVAMAKYPLERYSANHRMLGVCDKLHKLYCVESGVAVKLRSWGLEVVNELGSLKRFIVQSASE